MLLDALELVIMKSLSTLLVTMMTYVQSMINVLRTAFAKVNLYLVKIQPYVLTESANLRTRRICRNAKLLLIHLQFIGISLSLTKSKLLLLYLGLQ